MSQVAPPDERSAEALLFERLPFGAAILDEDLRIVRANPALAALAGVALADAHGRTLPELFPPSAPAIEQTLRTFSQVKLPLVDATLDLEAGPVQMSVSPLPSGLVVILRAAPRPAQEAVSDD